MSDPQKVKDRQDELIKCPHNIEDLIEQAAKRGARETLSELGIDDDSKAIIKNMIVFMKGVSVGRRALIWLAGFTGALYAIYLAAKKMIGE